ncbi:MAG: hypothetical protein U0893_04465 [Chloroflexota bacterium]
MRYYRIVQHGIVRRRDFASYGELGVQPKRPLSPREQDRWWGISVFSSEEFAIQRSDDSPFLGRYLAVLEIPHNATPRIEQTGRHPGHYTIWARAEDLLGWVISIIDLDGVQ